MLLGHTSKKLEIQLSAISGILQELLLNRSGKLQVSIQFASIPGYQERTG